MRTLLVDNYDSFTYNLFHYLTEVGGREPVVVPNDSPGWRPRMLEDFDCVVISPGPGAPGRTSDFGICREIIDTTRLPLLGICLGHQGIGLSYGAAVGRAPEPRHGRSSPVLHDGEGLFAGLPSPFEAVRYHSLAVTGLPEELEATAWTPDGVLMGLRHRERPMWGVQFHPESIGTRYGHEMLANFYAMARDTAAGPGRPPAAGCATAGRDAGQEAAAGRTLKVLTRQLPTEWDDEVVYDHLFRDGDHAFWLDSSRRRTSGQDGQGGRFSILGDATGPLARVATADVASGTVTVRSAGTEQMVVAPFMEWLERDLASLRTEVPPLPGDFALGWTGYLGYELKAECGGELAHRSEEPDAIMVFADRAVLMDHLTGITYLLALSENGEEGDAGEWFDRTAGLLAGLGGVTSGTSPASLSASAPAPAPAPASASASASVPASAPGNIRLRHDREGYLALIDECQEQIAAGESYEICLTNMAEFDGDIDLWQAYRQLRRTSPAPFGALLQFAETSVLSTSPERFLRISADGRVESKPIKGTRPRGATPAQDAALVADLLADEKDRAENLMIVDLVRHDLGRVAEIGSVRADDILAVESYATVHQLVSKITARLRPDRSAVDCVRSAFPGGSMTGAPKVRTMQIIDRLEDGPRGVYAGAIGYLSLSGAADLSIVIRTVVAHRDRIRYGVGGAVVALSDPASEFEETALKAAPLLAVTGARFPGRRVDELVAP